MPRQTIEFDVPHASDEFVKFLNDLRSRYQEHGAKENALTVTYILTRLCAANQIGRPLDIDK